MKLSANKLLLHAWLVSLTVVAYDFQYRGNPLVSHVSSADPDAHVWDDTVWIYTSTDGNLFEEGYEDGDSWTYAYMDGYRAFSTTDMINWVDHGEIFHSRDVSWGSRGWMWAPGAARRNGKYYLYYPHKDVRLSACRLVGCEHGLLVLMRCLTILSLSLSLSALLSGMAIGKSELPLRIDLKGRSRI